MEEAERLCDRIGIIDAGELMAEGTRRELTMSVGEQDRVHIVFSGSQPAVVEAVENVDGVKAVTVAENGLNFLADEAGTLVARVLDAITGTGAQVGSVEIAQPDLEAVFLHLTGKALRD